MIVNGDEVTISKACTLKEFLVQISCDFNRVAVEKNGRIIPKSNYDAEPVCNDDRLEIVTFVGGG